MKIELSEQDQQVLGTFLGRVQLTGNEVSAFNQLLKKLNTPIVEVETLKPTEKTEEKFEER